MALSVSCQGQGTFVILFLIVSCLGVWKEEGYENVFASWYSSESLSLIVFKTSEIPSLQRETDIFKRTLVKIRPVIYLICLYRNTLLVCFFFTSEQPIFHTCLNLPTAQLNELHTWHFVLLPRTSSRRWIRAHAMPSALCKGSNGLRLVCLTLVRSRKIWEKTTCANLLQESLTDEPGRKKCRETVLKYWVKISHD